MELDKIQLQAQSRVVRVEVPFGEVEVTKVVIMLIRVLDNMVLVAEPEYMPAIKELEKLVVLVLL